MRLTNETKALARAISDYIELHPERHEQDKWVGVDSPTETNVCNTTMCVAGTAVFLAEGVEGLRATISGSSPNFYDKGRRLLGLNVDEADALFYGSNTDAKQAIKALADGDENTFRELLPWLD